MTNIKARRYLLPDMFNVRDLGGFMTEQQKLTRYHRFLRTDVPCALSEQTKQFFAELDVRMVIDLRMAFEIEEEPNEFQAHETILYYNDPLIYKDELDAINEALDKNSRSLLGELYIHMINTYGDRIARVFHHMASIPYDQGSILFHCSHGKDRTGIISALLLDLVDVPFSDIIANYAESYQHLKPRLKKFEHLYPGNTIQLLQTDYWNMHMMLEVLDQVHHRSAAFLTSHSLSQAEIQTLKDRLLRHS